jgi:proteasome assembly chaperone (PAC2) family protein
MDDSEKLKDPWLVAVWPGMGSVAMAAGYYLMAKLGMRLLEELPARDLFDLDHVEVKDGLIQVAPLPRSRLFVWQDPRQRHDLVVFIGEAQPHAKAGLICRQLIDRVRPLGVESVFTFAAMATGMRPGDDSRVFGAAIDRATLDGFRQLDVEILESGQISGLNGILLGVAAESGLGGGCLLGEMPQMFAQVPFPKASHAVLEFFTTMAGIPLDLGELKGHARQVEKQLGEFLDRIEKAIRESEVPGDLPPRDEVLPGEKTPRPGTAERERIEQLFAEARQDRSRAYLLKQELDRLHVFAEYEDRFLDLFKGPEARSEDPPGNSPG